MFVHYVPASLLMQHRRRFAKHWRLLLNLRPDQFLKSSRNTDTSNVLEELNEKLPCSCTTNASQMVHRANMAMIVRWKYRCTKQVKEGKWNSLGTITWKILVFVTKYRSLRRLLEFGGCLTKTHSALLTEFERHRPWTWSAHIRLYFLRS